MMNTIETENRYGIPFTKRQPLSIARGAGNRVWDEAGREYLDFTSGWGVTCLGHCHPVLVEALQAQAALLTQNPNSGFTCSPVRARLLARLAPLLPAPLTRLYFVNSGAEANDVAIKMARKITGRAGIVSTLRAFHGRTYGTLNASGGTEAAENFPPRMQSNRFVPYNDVPALRAAMDDSVAAVIVEPIQGEGGVQVPDPSYLAEVSAVCQQHGALLIADEIQTGFGRTGSLFAIEQCQPRVHVDMMTLGKGLAGGFPFAALAMSEACAARVSPGDHGGTYCGNPLGCATALAVVDYLEREQVSAQVRQAGELMASALTEVQSRYAELIGAVRGRGLLWALQLTDPQWLEPVTEACLQQGLLITPTRGGVIRLIPSLLVSPAEIEQAMARLGSALASVPVREFTLDCSANVQAGIRPV